MTKTMLNVPEPQFFRQKAHCDRKLNKQEKKSTNFYYAVPRFFDFYHPTTVWLINVIRSDNEKEISRVLMDKESKGLLKFEPDPRALQSKHTVIGGKKDYIITKSKYFQILDRPEYYLPNESRFPMFNRHAVLYLTPLGLAIYLKRWRSARLLCQCVDRDTNKKHIQARQPQFISFINERFGDLMCMYDHNLAIINEAWEVLQYMLQYENWFPMEPFKLVYRKRFVETYLNFDDFLDYAFYVMFTKRSSIDIPGLINALLKCPSEHFRFNYMSQPSRATKLMLLRDADRIINNGKSYPRRLLRCAFYADRKLKSTLNLVRAASMFINLGLFKLVGDPAMPFVSKPGRRKRLETIPVYRERGRGIRVEWPQAYYEFDADCCIGLLVGIIAKCYRLGKKPTFAMAIRTCVKLLADAGWLNYFDIISDLEFKDYFMGLDDAEKVRFQPEIFSFVRECARIIVLDERHELARFFSEERLDRELRAMRDTSDSQVLTNMLMCNDENITKYVTLEKGEELSEAGTIIGGKRVRDQGRNDPKNKYYTDRLEFPRESTKTIMVNTANTEDSSGAVGMGDATNTSSSDAELVDINDLKLHNRSNIPLPGAATTTQRRPNSRDPNEVDVEMLDEDYDDDDDEDEDGTGIGGKWRRNARDYLVEAEVVHDRAVMERRRRGRQFALTLPSDMNNASLLMKPALQRPAAAAAVAVPRTSSGGASLLPVPTRGRVVAPSRLPRGAAPHPRRK